MFSGHFLPPFVHIQSPKGIIYHYQPVSIYKQRRGRGKRLIKEEIKSAMRIAVEKGHAGAGAILTKKGADCTEKEKATKEKGGSNLSFGSRKGIHCHAWQKRNSLPCSFGQANGKSLFHGF